MRRPRFHRWIRLECLRLAHTESFNLRKLTALAQQPGNEDLATVVFLYAHENGKLGKLMSYLHDDQLAEEFQAVEANLGQRSLERLALRNAPLLLMPERYRQVLARYKDAYHAPEVLAAEKQRLCDIVRTRMLQQGISPAEVARSLKLDPGNASAFLAHGDMSRFTLETTRTIAAHFG